MASLRLLARDLACALHAPRLRAIQIIKRDSQYRSSEKYDETKKYAEFETTNNPEEWKFVERLLPIETIPEPKVQVSKTGWKDVTAPIAGQLYFVRRTRNHMQPVYLQLSFRGTRRETLLKKIEGDIWALHDDLKKHLQSRVRMNILTQVNEFSGQIKYKTDCVKHIKEWLDIKGF